MAVKRKQISVAGSKTEASEEVTLTRGHKKKARTRQALLDAALRIFAQQGVAELQLNKLAEEANVSQGTVYNYFTSREEVLDAVGLEMANQFSHRISAVSEGIENGAQRTSVGIRMFIRETERNPLWASAIVSVYQYDQQIRSAVAGYLREDLLLGEKQGSFKFDNIEIAMGIVAFATIGCMAAILDGHHTAAVDTTVAKMLLMSLGMRQADAAKVANLPLPESTKNKK